MSAQTKSPRSIAVVDIGFTNSKVIQYDSALNVLAEHKVESPHYDGPHYREIDVAAILAFARHGLRELDARVPVDAIVPTSHGACIVSLQEDGSLALPVMDYTSQPPVDIVARYKAAMPSFEESYSPYLPMALLHAIQLYWQARLLPEAFARVRTILPLMQYVGHALGGRTVTEVSSLSCQSHLVDMRTGAPSCLAKAEGWAQHFAPLAKAWDVTGSHKGLRGAGRILAGVHDSNANFLRYLAAGQDRFTLMSTGTWVIGFDSHADMTQLDHTRDIVANKSVFGKTIACSRFFGGKEFEIIAQGAGGEAATLEAAARLVAEGTMALPSFTDSGGPVPGTGGRGRIIGRTPASEEERASLASVYCALMVSESLDALQSSDRVIIDGPFSQNMVFLNALATLRPAQAVLASQARDGTAAGAACLALMPDGKLPDLPLDLRHITPGKLTGLSEYHRTWRNATQT